MRSVVISEIYERCETDIQSGCWLWLGYIAPSGYGQIGRNDLVHRCVDEKLHGPIPDGWHVHHKCETRRCCNPEHLLRLPAGDHLRETLRMNGTDYLWKTRERPTHCPKGHSLEDAYHFRSRNRTVCRQCTKEQNDKRPRKTGRRKVVSPK